MATPAWGDAGAVGAPVFRASIARVPAAEVYFNSRSLALLADAIRRPDDLYTYQSHAGSHRVTHETARGDLLRLHERGLLRRSKIGRMHAYSPAADLPQTLQRLQNSNSK